MSVDERPYVIKTYDRWIILVIVLVVGWFLFRYAFAGITAYRGKTFEGALMYGPAEHYYRKAIAIDSAAPDGWLGLGELYYFWSGGVHQKYVDAADIFWAGTKAVSSRDREYPKLWFDLGRTYLIKLDDPKRAEDALRESVRLDPSKEFAWDYLAYAAIRDGDRLFALQCWRQVLKINPNHDSARQALRRYGG